MRRSWLLGFALVACQGLYNMIPVPDGGSGGASSDGGGTGSNAGGSAFTGGGAASNGGGSTSDGGGAASNGGGASSSGGGAAAPSAYSVLNPIGSVSVTKFPLTDVGSSFAAIHGLNANDLYAVGDFGLVFHFDGGSWGQAYQTVDEGSLTAVRVLANGTVIVGGYSHVLTCTGGCDTPTGWVDQAPLDPNGLIEGICSRDNVAWLVGEDRASPVNHHVVYAYDGAQHALASTTQIQDLASCAVLPDGNLLIVGTSIARVALDGGGVTIEAVPPAPDPSLPEISAIVVDSSGVAWGVGYSRRLLRRDPSGVWTTAFAIVDQDDDPETWFGLAQLPSGTLLAAGRNGDAGPIGLFDGGLNVLRVPPATDFTAVWVADEHTWFFAGLEYLDDMGETVGVLYRVAN